MNALERLKRKVVSRLTDEVDITYFNNGRVDNRVAFLRYKDRELLVQKTGENDIYSFYMKLQNEYRWRRVGSGYGAMELVIEQAKQGIKDEHWK